MTDDDPTRAVAQDLRAINELFAHLPAQALRRAAHREIPGGAAMYAMAPNASPRDWERRLELTERDWWATHPTVTGLETGWDEDGFEPPLQTLLFWTETLRPEPPIAPTIGTEASFLLVNLRAIYDAEPQWDDLAKDIHGARLRLENMLYAGERDELTHVPCLDCHTDRHGQPIRRFLVRYTTTLGLSDHWTCPRCDRRYDRDHFNLAKMHALEEAARQVEDGTTAV